MVRPVGVTGQTGRLGRSDRSCWLISCLYLLDLALRNHGSILVEVLVPLLLYLMLLLLVPKVLQLPLLYMQPRRTPPGLMILIHHAAVASLMIIDWPLHMNVDKFPKNHRSLAHVVNKHFDIANLYNIISFGLL